MSEAQGRYETGGGGFVLALAALYDHRHPHRVHHTHAHTHGPGTTHAHTHRHGHYGTRHGHPFAHRHWHLAPGHTADDGDGRGEEETTTTMDAESEARLRRIWGGRLAPDELEAELAAVRALPEEPEAPPAPGPCPSCGALTAEQWEACAGCRAKLPPSLIKACTDTFFYACRLRTGEVLHFEEATVHGEYVTLKGHERSYRDGGAGFVETELPHPCPRGVDVRIADIVWCADAPDGS